MKYRSLETFRNDFRRLPSAHQQMFLQVLPLEKGTLDETVRVKVAGSGQILRGRVIAPGQLEAQF